MKEIYFGKADFLRPSNKIWKAQERARLVRLWNSGIKIYKNGEKAGWICIERKQKASIDYEGIDKAERALVHSLNVYFSPFSEESDRLGEIISVNSLRGNIGGLHDIALLGSRMKSSDKETAAEDISAAREILQNCREKIKVGLRKKYESLEDFLDSLGRLNTGASAAKLVLMAKQAKMRAENVRNIIKWTSRRKLLLAGDHLIILSQIEQAMNRVDFLYSRPSWIVNKDTLNSFCVNIKELLRGVWCLPYLPQIKKIVGLIDNSLMNDKLAPEIKRGILKSIFFTLEKMIVVGKSAL